MRVGQRHPTATVEMQASVGKGSEVLQYAVVRERARIGDQTRICSHAYIDAGVEVGSYCKIKNGAQLFTGAVVGDYVFIGPGARLLNDRTPSARRRKGPPYERVVIEDGASIGAGAIIFPGVRVGRDAIVGAGAVVMEDVPPETTVVGIPARRVSSASRNIDDEADGSAHAD